MSFGWSICVTAVFVVVAATELDAAAESFCLGLFSIRTSSGTLGSSCFFACLVMVVVAVFRAELDVAVLDELALELLGSMALVLVVVALLKGTRVFRLPGKPLLTGGLAELNGTNELDVSILLVLDAVVSERLLSVSGSRFIGFFTEGFRQT